MLARASFTQPSRVDLGSTAAPPLGCISKWQWVAPPWASPVSPTKPMTVPCLTLWPLEMPGAKSLAWAQKKKVPLGISRYTSLPPTGSSLKRTVPSFTARIGVPPAAKTSLPWCMWKVGVNRGMSQSSDQLAKPATGKWPKPMLIASWGVSPKSSRGRRASISPAVLLGGVRLTALIWAWASAGTVWDPGLVVVVVVGPGGGWVGGGWVGGGGLGCVGGGFTTVVVGWGSVEGGLVVDGDVCGGAVVVGGGVMICARACLMAAAPKAMVASTTIPAARQRALTLCCSPRLG